MNGRFAGKTALITGAAVGIGRATALLFAKEGANLVLFDVDKEGLKSLAAELPEGRAATVVCDVSDENAVKEGVSVGEKKFGKIDILVNNAALWRVFTPFTETSAETWRKLLEINVMGVVNCTLAVLPEMIKRGYGRIVNVASVAGVYGNTNMSAYSATKGAIISLTRSVAKEVADKGVRVNSVSPGTVSDSQNKDVTSVQENDRNYCNRTGSGEENASLIAFLASDEANYITGENVLIDGARKII